MRRESDKPTDAHKATEALLARTDKVTFFTAILVGVVLLIGIATMVMAFIELAQVGDVADGNAAVLERLEDDYADFAASANDHNESATDTHKLILEAMRCIAYLPARHTRADVDACIDHQIAAVEEAEPPPAPTRRPSSRPTPRTSPRPSPRPSSQPPVNPSPGSPSESPPPACNPPDCISPPPTTLP